VGIQEAMESRCRDNVEKLLKPIYIHTYIYPLFATTGQVIHLLLVLFSRRCSCIKTNLHCILLHSLLTSSMCSRSKWKIKIHVQRIKNLIYPQKFPEIFCSFVGHIF
jgi:hypothetical protein